ncbi:MAG: RHS repeat-associated core domain-containing protein, partial [Leptospiraceae bacterium]|nr:RHS repeat-associated core domain-containing protein [Leptospiraceae bacterium]
ISRGNSYGPDIFRYKYTAQQEDSESGLYYYNSRYYDPTIGQFLQADSVIGLNTPLGTNQYTYTEGNPVRFTDPRGYTSYEGMMNRMAKDLAKAVITEVSGQSDIMAAATRKYMLDKNHEKEKKLTKAINFQLIWSTIKVVVGAILVATGFFAPLGVSLIASGLAGIIGYLAGGNSKGHFDRAKALRTSKLAAGIVGIAMFVYSFGDWAYSNLLSADKVESYQSMIDEAAEINADVDPETGLSWNDSYGDFGTTFASIKYLGDWNFYQFCVNYNVAELTEKYLTLGDLNVTEALDWSSLNFPGYLSTALVALDIKDIDYYNPDIKRSNRASVDNHIYYYRESVRKGLYFTPYLMNFLKGGL